MQAPWPDSGYLRRDFESCVLEGDQECSWVEGQTFQDEEVITIWMIPLWWCLVNGGTLSLRIMCVGGCGSEFVWHS